MHIYVALLRAINLASRNRIAMEPLRKLFEALGFLDPRTFIQSGNVCFGAAEADEAILAARIGDAVEREFGFRTDVILRTPAELHAVLERNPFAARPDLDPARLLIYFLDRAPAAAHRNVVLALKTHPEELRIEGREVYIYYPNGMARPTLATGAMEKKLGARGTGRNLNTVKKLLELALNR